MLRPLCRAIPCPGNVLIALSPWVAHQCTSCPVKDHYELSLAFAYLTCYTNSNLRAWAGCLDPVRNPGLLLITA